MPTIFRDVVTAQPTGKSPVSFNDPLALPSTAVVWGLDVLDGWDTSADLDSLFAPIGTVDGEVAGDFFPAKGRQLSIGGYVMAATRADAEALADVVMGDAFPRNTDIVVTRYEATPKWMRGRVSGPRVVERVGPYAFRWAVPFRCPNPLKFALSPIVTGNILVAGRSSGGRSYPRTYPLTYTTVTTGAETSVTIFNAGTGSTYPVVTLHGPLNQGAWRLVNESTGGFIRVDLSLSSTDTMVIDFDSQVITVNGYVAYGTIVGDFWQIVRGNNVIKLYADFDPAAWFNITVYSAWEN